MSTNSSPATDGAHGVTVADLGLGPTPLVATGKDTRARHVLARLDNQLRALVAHEDGTRSGDDPEDLHQMRVSVRRMRAALKAEGGALGPVAATLDGELRWLGAALGPVRDLDVQLARLRADADEFDDAERRAVDSLLAGLVAERKRARRRMLTALRSPRYRALCRALAGVIASTPDAMGNGNKTGGKATDGAPAATDLISPPYRKLRRAVDALGEVPADADLHALRIRGKRLRYAAELAGTTGGRRVRRLIDATQRLQEVLGEHQDAAVAETRIRRLLDERDNPADADVVFVAGRLVEREHARKATYRGLWRAAWDKVDRRASRLL